MALPALGVSITRFTSSALRLGTAKVQPIHQISPDGIFFPSTADAFLAEARTQGLELYGGRKHVQMDPSHFGSLNPFTQCSSDIPHYSHLLRQYCSLPQSDDIGQLSPGVLQDILRKSSDATALDAIPTAVLRRIGGSGLAVLCSLPRALDLRRPSNLLQTALLLPLKKKSPHWLLRNSRLVLVEPVLRRAEAAAAFHEFMYSAELHGFIPSAMLAYRRGMSVASGVLAARWWIWAWSSTADLWIADWDESNAFCNIPREDLANIAPRHGRRLSNCPRSHPMELRILHGNATCDNLYLSDCLLHIPRVAIHFLRAPCPF